MQVVWFKRDLRWHDHAPLTQAFQATPHHGPVLCLYVLEPSLWAQPDMAAQHLGFIRESLAELHSALRHLGGHLHVEVGEVVDVLARIHAQAPITVLRSHEETGNAHTFARDRTVARWCRAHGVPWHEHRQFGVVRALNDRNQWQRAWEDHMALPQAPLPPPDAARFAAASITPEATWPTPQQLGLDPHQPPHRQRGGRTEGMAVLHDFLNHRCARYRGGISSPLSAPDACSRLSAHLAYGTLSLREVVQATRARMAELAEQAHSAAPDAQRQRAGLSAFVSRLYWHCHFIQKLESQPDIEWRNLHRGYDGLREPDWNPAHFAALTQGRTGWPLVDACVAMLHHTGWLNFRMRAMLVSVASYPLWLHWQPVGLWLAREFLDYEPGIHWSQMQMQAGTTGINTTRVYNPIKQAQDHDPHGHFVRRWLPPLRRVPDAWLFEPWRMPPSVQRACGVTVGVDIPEPLVDLATATRTAKARLHALRAQPEVKAAKAAIVQRHGSRKNMPGATARDAQGHETTPRRRTPNPPTTPSSTPQLSLDF